MTPVLSPNTQAILLLTAPLIAGRDTASSDLLSPGEYKRLARHLREIQRQPADLLSPDAAEILRACQPVIDESRLQGRLHARYARKIDVSPERLPACRLKVKIFNFSVLKNAYADLFGVRRVDKHRLCH